MVGCTAGGADGKLPPDDDTLLIGTIDATTRTRIVRLGGRELDLARSLKLANHSPTGFSWGYGGSGVAQLALAVLLEITDEDTALRHYQALKWEIFAKLEQDKGFEIHMGTIHDWLRSLPEEESEPQPDVDARIKDEKLGIC